MVATSRSSGSDRCTCAEASSLSGGDLGLLLAPEARDDARRPEQVLEVGPADVDDAGADLDCSEVAVGAELADEALGDGQPVGRLRDRQETPAVESALGDNPRALGAVALPAQGLKVLGQAEPTPGHREDVVHLEQQVRLGGH